MRHTLTLCWFNAELQNSYCPFFNTGCVQSCFFAAHCFTLHIFYSNCIYICSREKSQTLPMGNELTIFSISFWSSNLLYVMLILLLRPSVEKCAQINWIFWGILMQIYAYFTISKLPGLKISLKIAIFNQIWRNYCKFLNM